MRHGSLFSGIGGFDLAAEWMGWENVFHCEKDEYCRKLLKQHWPGAKSLGDISETNFKPYAKRVDILTGGFPCQDISISGRGKGITGTKSGLWVEYSRAIKEIHPKYVVIENSPQLLRKGFEKVLYDLSESGYNAEWECISASDIGLPHIRERVWVVAYPNAQGWRGVLHMLKRSIVEKNKAANPLDSSRHPFLRFEERCGQPAVFGMDDGLPKKLDVVKRLGGAGNAIAPGIAYKIFKAIGETEQMLSDGRNVERSATTDAK